MKLVSIVLPTYNGEQFLKESIDSIISQTYRNWELIIVNDCSSDSTKQIANEYAARDSRIKVINNAKNQKTAKSLNIGFNVASGQYWTWTSDDNYYLSSALEMLVQHLDNNRDDVMVHTAFKLKNLITGTEDKIVTKTSIEDLLCKCTCGPCFMYRATVAREVGDYDDDYMLVHDWDYWLRMRLIGNIGYINEAPYVYCLHSDCLTSIFQEQFFFDGEVLRKKYIVLYAEKFKNIKDNFNFEILIYKYTDSADRNILEELKSRYLKKRLYQEYKLRFIKYKNEIWLRAIESLGIIYRLRAINLMRKYKTEDN